MRSPKRKRKRRGFPNTLPDARPGESVYQTIGRRGGRVRAASGDLQKIAPLGAAVRAKQMRKPPQLPPVQPPPNLVVASIDDMLARLTG